MKETPKTNPSLCVKELIAKAVGAEDSQDTMRFSQAALNAANALAVLKSHQIS